MGSAAVRLLYEDVISRIHRRHFGSAMHIFLLDIPRLEFAAMIPKGDYLTVCLLGRHIDRDLISPRGLVARKPTTKPSQRCANRVRLG